MCKDAENYIQKYMHKHEIPREEAMEHEIVKLMIEEYERKELEKDGTSSGNQVRSEFKECGC